MNRNTISSFLENHFLHFNAAALVDAAKAYENHLEKGGKMLVSIGGAMSTAELGKTLAEMIRQDKIHSISCTGANLEEDIMNLVAHSHYKRVQYLYSASTLPDLRTAVHMYIYYGFIKDLLRIY